MLDKIIDILDILERKVLKGNKLIIVPIILVVVIGLTAEYKEEEIIPKAKAHETRQENPTISKKYGIEKKQIKWGNRLYNIQVWHNRVNTMKELGYSDTRILDLLAIMNMECGLYTGKCFNGNDIGPMQINKIYREQYSKSWEFYNKEDWEGLFKYQLQYANQLVQSYEDRFCGPHIFKIVGKEYTNKKRWNCVAKSYNGHPRYKYAYMQLGWERREIIKEIIYK